jgi:hypothetical protein
MKNEFIPYEQALELKELGFDEPCIAFYEPGNKQVQVVGVEQRYNNPELLRMEDFCAPLYQIAFRWFREKSFICHVTNDLSDSCYDEIYVYVMTKGYGDLIDRSEEYRTYEEAELACIKKLIEIVKTKEK